MKTIVITGANRGIGLGFAKYYSQNGYSVYALCRQSSNELNQLNVNVIEDFSLTASSEKIKALTQDIKNIDLLINNAAQWGDEKLGKISYDNIFNNFNVNALGTLKVTEALLDKMKSGSKIIFMTSRMGSIADNNSGGRYAYRMSKAALNAAAKSVSVDVKPKGIPVAIIHPGWVQTQMGGPNALISVERSVKDINVIIEKLNLENTGTFWHSNGEVLAW